jgi:hypothetical protein
LPNRLRHCSVCDAENRDHFGETFWSRLHQITGINVCPVHRCFLQDTSVTRSSRGTFKASSADSVCRDCTPRYIDDCDQEQVIQYKRDVAWLLDLNRPRPGPKVLSKAYLYCAVNHGLVSYGGRFRQSDFQSAFTRRYSKKLLRSLGLDLKEGRKSWLKRLFQEASEIQYPIRHLIVMNFLGFTAAAFFDQLSYSGPFGVPPWPCLNPVSACRNKYRKTIGDFVCPQCGFMYSRFGPDTCEQDRRRMDWVREYGHAWDAELRKVWADPKCDLTEAASRLGLPEA